MALSNKTKTILAYVIGVSAPFAIVHYCSMTTKFYLEEWHKTNEILIERYRSREAELDAEIEALSKSKGKGDL